MYLCVNHGHFGFEEDHCGLKKEHCGFEEEACALRHWQARFLCFQHEVSYS